MIRILQGDCRDILKTLQDESVHCVVTSPPYFGLRDYGTAKWEGGDSNCDHVEGPARQDQERETPGGRGGSFRGGTVQYRAKCPCGARRIDSQIGLERTPQEYVEQLVTVFREVRRVLRKDGTAWLNLGDSYAGGGHGGGGSFEAERNWRNGSGRADGVVDGRGQRNRDGLGRVSGLKPKDLIGIPWRVAFALQADGWWLRQDIIWSKPNPMPESVTDRCTKAHEYIFLLSKSARYYYDADAIKTDATESSIARLSQPNLANQKGSDRVPGKTNGPMKAVFGGRNKANGYGTRIHSGNEDQGHYLENGVNRRSVWEVATQPFSEAHFATFPPALIEPCILAGCPKGGTVLDPFGGAGTTGLIADRLGRNAILIELNPEYAAMARQRISADAGMFAEIAAK